MKLFITSTNTDVGKTYVTTHLYHYLTRKGLKVHIIKPFQTEVLPDGKYPDLESYQKCVVCRMLIRLFICLQHQYHRIWHSS